MGAIFWICIILLTAIFIGAMFCPIRIYTAYQLTATAAWRDWEVWKHKLEEQGFSVELKEVEQNGGCSTNFYYIIRKKPLK